MKKTFILCISTLLLASCAAPQQIIYREAEGRNIEPALNAVVTPLVADLQLISEQSISELHTFDVNVTTDILKDIDKYKNIALLRTIKEHNVDTLVGTIVNVDTNKDGKLEITVTGYPARFANFRPMDKEDMWIGEYYQKEGAQPTKTSISHKNVRVATITEVESPKEDFTKKNQKGFQQSVEFNLSTVSNELAGESGMKVSLGLDYIGGYRLSNAIYLGAGIGFEYHKYGTMRIAPYDHISYNQISFPLYINFRYYITNSRLQPFLYMSAGGNFGPKGELQFSYNDVRKFNTIGALLVPGLGFNYRISARCGLYLGVSYSLRTLPAVESYSIEKTTLQTSLFHGATIKLGCTF